MRFSTHSLFLTLRALRSIAGRMGVMTAYFLTIAVHGSVIERAEDTTGTFVYKTSGGGTVALVENPVRAGTHAHASSLMPAAGSRRAEIDDNQFGYYKDDTFWYAMSYYLPNDGSWDGNFSQYVGQLRLSDLKQNGFSVQNCTMVCSRGGIQKGGAGHHLEVNNGQWVFDMAYQDPAAASCAGTLARRIVLGPINKGVWTDFVIQAKWSHLSDGSIRFWKQVNGGSYVKAAEYKGPNWYDTYAAGSNLAGVRVHSPNFTAGLYYGSDGLARTVFVDEIRTSDFPGKDGFEQVRVGGKATPDLIGTQNPGSVNIGGLNGGSSTYDSLTDAFLIHGAGVGLAGTSDQFRLTYLILDGDGEIIIKTGYLANSPGAQAGLMIRHSLAVDAAHMSIGTQPDGQLLSQWRTADGGTTESSTLVGGASPGKAIRIVRFRDTFKTYYSGNGTGTGWVPVASQTIAMGNTSYVGLYTASGNGAATVAANFSLAGINRSTGATPQAPPPDGSGATLMARYRFESNLQDTVANGAALTAQGAPDSDHADHREGNKALVFDGIDDRATTPATPSLSPTGSFTFSAWVKPVLGTTQVLISNSFNTTSFATDAYQISLTTDGHITMSLGNTQGGGVITGLSSLGAVANNAWSHVAVAVDCQGAGGGKASYAFFYINGLLSGTYGISQPNIKQGLGTVVIGARQSTGTNLFKGVMDDIQLYTGAITAAEAVVLAAGGEISCPIPPSADVDHDGISNLLEYALGLKPYVPDVTGLPIARTKGTTLGFTYTRNIGASNVTCAVETSTRLDGPWAEVQVPPVLLADNGVLRTFRADFDINAEPRRFMRLRTTLMP